MQAAVEEMRSRYHENVCGVIADVTDASQARHLVQHTVEKCGKLDALFNIVGSSGVRGSLLESSPTDIRELLEQNVYSLIHTTRSALPHLVRSRGRVVNMGSLASLMAPPNYGGYAVAKFGVRAATEQLRVEHFDVSFTLVCPGPICEDGKERASGGARLEGLDPEQLAAEIIFAAGKRRRLLVRPRRAHALRFLMGVWPFLGEKIMRRFSDASDSPCEDDTQA